MRGTEHAASTYGLQMRKSSSSLAQKGEVMDKVSTLAANGNAENIAAVIGIDLAKNVFALHAVNRHGKPVLVKPNVRRDQLLELVAQLPPCIIGMEACSGAHHWAREFAALGHTPRLMAPKFVIPYRIQGKRGKNDAN